MYRTNVISAPHPLSNNIIRDTYNVLLTRGMRGTFIYCEDKCLSNYLKSLIKLT
ncbi:MAG: DUF2075 domain-containing protein [Mycoplasmataceae bacterium]|nr:DUF2075 domain-containing protein [Mycoplasmataceae bacterium]